MTVYVLSTDDSGAYKIGHTTDWTTRLRTYENHAYQVTVHFLDHTAGRDVEERLHELFWDRRASRNDARREWFMLDAEDLELLRGLLRDSRGEAAARIRASAQAHLESLDLLERPDPDP